MLRWLLLVVAGAAICTYGDSLHASHGVLTYERIVFGVQDWWVPLLFAAAAIVTVVAAKPFVDWGRKAGTARAPDAVQVAADAIGFFFAYAYTSFAPWDRPNVTLAVLVIAFVVRVLGERKPSWLICYCVLLGFGGVVTEFLVSSTGRFHYLHPDVLSTPRWLGGIYLHAGLLSGQLALVMLPERSKGAATLRGQS